MLFRSLRRRDVLDVLGAQQRAHGSVPGVVGGDGENAHGYAASPGGNSAVSSQYAVKTLISRTSARNVTGLTM